MRDSINRVETIEQISGDSSQKFSNITKLQDYVKVGFNVMLRMIVKINI